MADDNEIMTADTQAEKTADTADTGQTTPTTEELIQQLTARVAALEEIVGEDEYELRYSGVFVVSLFLSLFLPKNKKDQV